MDQTWNEIVKSMSSLENDIRKNAKSKLAKDRDRISVTSNETVN